MNYINSISLITAFFGGMVALFAPCCITFLLPTYLGNVFRSHGRVLGMTLIFGLGIATVLVPTALGIQAIGQIFQTYHTQMYVFGGVFMIMLGVMEITGKKITLPMLNLTIDLTKHNNPWSVYLLGVFSGITSSCCTPVLAGILTLSFLSPSFFWAGMAGFSYVAGMVVPLVLMALLLNKINWKKLPLIRKQTLKFIGKPILVSDLVAGLMFIIVGITFSYLALTNRITMGETQSLEQTLGLNLLTLVKFLRSIPYSEYIFAFILISVVYFLIKKQRN